MAFYVHQLFGISAVVFLSFTTRVTSSNSECGILENKNKIPWTVGIYLEKEKDHLELVCLGTVLKDNYIITASQCVYETLSKDIRKESIYVSKTIQKIMKKTSEALGVKSKNVINPKEYQGFWLNPIGDLAIIKIEETSKYLSNYVCVDWSDRTKLIQDNTAGILSVWVNKVITTDSFNLDYDLCLSSTTENFGSILGADKNCFEISKSNLDPQSIGSGIYYQNSKDGRWYLEGVVSGTEKDDAQNTKPCKFCLF